MTWRRQRRRRLDENNQIDKTANKPIAEMVEMRMGTRLKKHQGCKIIDENETKTAYTPNYLAQENEWFVAFRSISNVIIIIGCVPFIRMYTIYDVKPKAPNWMRRSEHIVRWRMLCNVSTFLWIFLRRKFHVNMCSIRYPLQGLGSVWFLKHHNIVVLGLCKL